MEGNEGLLEPTSTHKGLLMARSFSAVGENNEVPVQMINVGHEEITIYKGTRLGLFSLGHHVMNVAGERAETVAQNDRLPAIDLTQSDITPEEKLELEKFLYDFRDLFVYDDGPLGKNFSSEALNKNYRTTH